MSSRKTRRRSSNKEEMEYSTPEEEEESDEKQSINCNAQQSLSRPPSKSASHPWQLTDIQFRDIIKRIQIITLDNNGYSESLIVKALNNEVSPAMVKKWRHCELVPAQLVDSNRTGRPDELHNDFVDELLRKAKKSGFSPRKFVRSSRFHVSRTSVRDILHRHGLSPYKKRKTSRLTSEHVAKRLNFCKWFAKQPLTYYENILITDSKIWRLDGGYNPQNARYWRVDAKEVPVHDEDKYPESIHIYGGISAKACTRLITIKGTLVYDLCMY